METQKFDISKIDKKIDLLTFGYIREVIENECNDTEIQIPKNIILLFACFANIYIDSKILNDFSEINTFVELVSNELQHEDIKEYNLELIYRASRDGANAECFWNKCMSINKIFILIHNNNDHKFGCYLSIGRNVKDNYNWITDKKCFIYQIKPNLFVYKHCDTNKCTIYHGVSNQTLWLGGYGGALNIRQDFTNSGSCYSDPECRTFVDLNCKELVGGDSIDNKYYWNIVELEVYRIK